MVTPQQHADAALAEWQRNRALPPKERVLVVICNSIINNDRIRRADPFAVEMLEDELKRYRELLKKVEREMADA